MCIRDRSVFANDAALNNATSRYETLAERESVYDLPLEDMAGYDNPMMDGNVAYSRIEEPSAALDDRNAYESVHDDQPHYTPLTPPCSDNIGHKNTQGPPTDAKYLVLLDDKGKLGNPPEVPPPRIDKNTQEQPTDTMYLELLDDEDNTPDVPSPRDNIGGHQASLV